MGQSQHGYHHSCESQMQGPREGHYAATADYRRKEDISEPTFRLAEANRQQHSQRYPGVGGYKPSGPRSAFRGSGLLCDNYPPLGDFLPNERHTGGNELMHVKIRLTLYQWSMCFIYVYCVCLYTFLLWL